VVIGVTGDQDAAGYKRPPVICQEHRVAVVSALREVDVVLCPCPLVVTEEFMARLGIDLVVHGFASDVDAQRQREFFALPMDTGRFQRIGYYEGLSTTDIINKIRDTHVNEEASAQVRDTCADRKDGSAAATAAAAAAAAAVSSSAAQALALRKPKWFGAAVAAATDCASAIPMCPFPLALRSVIEPFVRKATVRRAEVLSAVREATGAAQYDTIMSSFSIPSGNCLAQEGKFAFDVSQYPLREAFLNSAGLAPDSDLSRLHEDPDGKDVLLGTLTASPLAFQQEFDRFVTSVCAPRLAALFHCEEVYYQAFPCIRVVQPDDFSIGPHADASYGHHPCSINFYLPLTDLGGTSSLFLETSPGREDWHPLEGGYGGVTHFAGAVCAHWTTENKTQATRVSLDFRMIPGPLFRALECGGAVPGGQLDVYRQREGYYSCCRRRKVAKAASISTTRTCGSGHSSSSCDEAGGGGGDSSDSCDDGGFVWERLGPLLQPDARIGFPWTVKDMQKYVATSIARRGNCK
jgi:glycerol-3-phosphate cytidylyltransferase-like family protein